MRHIPKKRFGQNFLNDSQIIQRIIDAIAPTEGQHIVEIGPGQGALTLPVLKKIKQLDVVELDRDLIPELKTLCEYAGDLTVHQCDALEFDFRSLVDDDRALRVIGNLPYNISTPLIFHLLEFSADIIDMHFMLQKEVVDRLAGRHGTSDFGRLSVMVQYHCEVTSLFDVPPESFTPAPKVNSSIVRIIPYKTPPFIANDYSHFAALVKQAFSQRRKTLRNCLKAVMTSTDWERVGVDPTLRAEQLTVEDYVRMSNILNK